MSTAPSPHKTVCSVHPVYPGICGSADIIYSLVTLQRYQFLTRSQPKVLIANLDERDACSN
jgi:hypothetical protein